MSDTGTILNGLEYKVLRKKESHGTYGSFGIQILVAGSRPPDLDGEELRAACCDAVDAIQAAYMAASIELRPETAPAKAHNRGLAKIFPDPVFVEEIPNGYCDRYCCRHLPWFVVTTNVGRITIGHRKRVISIDWGGTVGTLSAQELFPDEDVTKHDKMIHAWSIEDAKRYVATILNPEPKSFSERPLT